ncbi:outer membrane protein assembly factor BamB family protein [Streptomyces sp. NPDC002306]
MTQPPDQQPPQGGFGAPRGGPSSDGPGHGPGPGPGFGAAPPPPPGPPRPGHDQPRQPGPYDPQQQPGPYGPPPQQPGPYAQPQQPGPYGSPQQPGPYGSPQQPGPYGPQPGYGYPPQPQFPGAPGTPPPTGSRNPFRKRSAQVVGAVVVALLVVGGVVVALTSGDDDKEDKGGKGGKPVAGRSDDAKPTAPVDPGDGDGGGAEAEDLNAGRKPGEAKVLWYKEAPDAPGSGADAPGMWITDRTAVKAAYKEIVAYDVGDGKPTWEPITFPQKICAATPVKTSDDKIVVAYMDGVSSRAKCNQLQQIDLATGAKGWTAEVADGALFDSAISIELTLAGDTLMAGRSQSGTAYDVHSGKKLFDKKRYGTDCFPSAFAGGAQLVSVASCDATGAGEHDEVQGLDPRTGKTLWTQKLDKGWTVERAYSVDPLVLYLTNQAKNAWNISTIKSDGTFRSEVGFDEDFAPDCGWAVLDRDLQGCQGVAADANTLYLPTEATGANEIVAVDLSTGKEKWRVKSPADASMLPVRIEGGKLVAYVEPSYDAGGQVVSIPTTGSARTTTKLLQNPAGTARIEGGFTSRSVDWVDGRFYISSTRLTGKDDAREKLMLAFGK